MNDHVSSRGCVNRWSDRCEMLNKSKAIALVKGSWLHCCHWLFSPCLPGQSSSLSIFPLPVRCLSGPATTAWYFWQKSHSSFPSATRCTVGIVGPVLALAQVDSTLKLGGNSSDRGPAYTLERGAGLVISISPNSLPDSTCKQWYPNSSVLHWLAVYMFSKRRATKWIPVAP